MSATRRALSYAFWTCCALIGLALALGYAIRSTPQIVYLEFGPKETPPLMAVGRLDTIGGHLSCGVELRLVRLDR